MAFQLIVLGICGVGCYQAWTGTSSMTARISMLGLIACIVVVMTT